MVRLVILALALSVAASPALRADDVTMKDGKVHADLAFVKETDKMLYFETRDGKSVSFSKDSVEKREQKPTDREEYRKRKAALKPKDAAGLFELAVWAKEHEMPNTAKQDFDAVVKIDNQHAGAHEALGHKQLEGKWLSDAEYKKASAAAAEAEAKAKGWKKWKDTWVSPLDYARLDKGLVKYVDSDQVTWWVTADTKKKIESEGWTFVEGEWVSPKDKEKLAGGMRMFRNRWMSVEDLDETFNSLDNPWILKGRNIDVATNAPNARGVKFREAAEDAYSLLESVFGDVHKDRYEERGSLLVLVGKGIKDYQTLGHALGRPDRVAMHSSGFGSFYAPEFRTKNAENKEVTKGAGISYDAKDDDGHNRNFIGHAVAHAWLDRYLPDVESNETLVEAMAAYTSCAKKGKYAPNRNIFSRFLISPSYQMPAGSQVTKGLGYKSEVQMIQAGFFIHFLRSSNPEAFTAFWQGYGTSGTRTVGKATVSRAGSIEELVHACLGKRLDADAQAIDADFAAFYAKFKESYTPWGR